MRLVHRDRGCVVCIGYRGQGGMLPQGHEIYSLEDDSNRFEGAHIIDLAHYELVSFSLFNSQLC